MLQRNFQVKINAQNCVKLGHFVIFFGLTTSAFASFHACTHPDSRASLQVIALALEILSKVPLVLLNYKTNCKIMT